MAKEPAFPNLPEKKTCPVCKKEFPRPVLSDGKLMSSREWYNKKYCSRKCAVDNRRRSGDRLFK